MSTDETALKLDADQERAVELITTVGLGIVTGGPGVGKTTVVKTAVDRIVKEHRIFPTLCAPTGKAARRLTEATGRAASTLHRVLGYAPDGRFLHNASNRIDAKRVVVDEASMVDTVLMGALCEALPDRASLILVGDANQLPSVGPGQVLADLIASKQVPVVELRTLHRAAQESWICRNAPHVLAGYVPELTESADFAFWRSDNEDAAAGLIVNLFAQRGACWNNDPAFPISETQVLTPMHKGALGTRALNERLQDVLNPAPMGDAQSFRIGNEQRARVGDRVICMRNNYDLGVMNGECGRVLLFNDQHISVDFEGPDGPVSFKSYDALDLQLAYALTIHKSQGSEWPWVVVVCHKAHYHMLSRQLFYTAITRAKKGVIVVGDDGGLGRALNNNQPANRVTRLKERLNEAIHGRTT